MLQILSVRLPSTWRPTPPDAPLPWLDGTMSELDPMPTENAERAWFRWITGHQACLGCWRLAGMNLMALVEYRTRIDALVRETELLLRTSGAMVRYAGSCTSDVYAAEVRPSMLRCHPGFTGRWSIDYAPLPGLIRAVSHPETIGNGPADVLRAAFAAYTQMHAQAAQRLVPEGGSLLREHGGWDALTVDPATGAQLFEAFFHVERAPATIGEVRADLRRRLETIAAELRGDQALGLTQATTCRS